MATLSHPSRVVWDYFFSLRKLSNDAAEAPSSELARQSAALAIVMAVTVVEVFLNLWFRVRVEEAGDPDRRSSLLRDLERRASLDHKLRKWPLRYLSTEIDLQNGPGAEFMAVKELRNSIVHFTSTHESVQFDEVAFHGLANTTAYDALGASEAAWALRAAENMVAEVFRAAGTSAERIPHALHAWAGKPPV